MTAGGGWVNMKTGDPEASLEEQKLGEEIDDEFMEAANIVLVILGFLFFFCGKKKVIKIYCLFLLRCDE